MNRELPVNYKHLLSLILFLGTLSFLAYFFRPWIHSIALGIYKTPVLLETVLIPAILLTAYAFIFVKSSGDRKPQLLVTAASIGFVTLLVFGLPVAEAFKNRKLAEQVQAEADTLQKLPDIDPERPRILPKSVAEEYASNSLQTPRYTLKEADIAIMDSGKPYWSMAKKPDGLYNYFSLKQEGAAFVDMTIQEKKISYTDDRMQFGLGMGVTDNVMWQLKKQRFWVEYEDPITLKHNGKTFIAVPYKQFNFHFDFPVFYTTPEWGGVALVNPEGDIKFLNPEEASRNKVLEDQRLYPYDLARQKVSSLAYKHGILNAWFTHRDQLEVAEVPGIDNDQPFTILTEDGPKLFVAAEPYGNAQGLFQIWTIDAVTGNYSVLKLNRSEALLGANKATNYVRKANSKVNWADRASGEETVQTGFKPSEPIPVVVNDTLYWQVRVVPLDSAGIAFTSFVNAETGDVINAQTDDRIIEFLRNEKLDGQAETPGEEVSGDKTVEGVWEIVVMENGKVQKRVKVGENQSVRFNRIR